MKKNISTTPSNILPIPVNVSEIFTDFSEFVTAITDPTKRYGIRSVIELKLNEIVITDEGAIQFGTDNLTLSLNAAKQLCSSLKIPFAFGSKIPIHLLRENIDELKEINNGDIKLIVNNHNVIVNISKKKNYATGYMKTLCEWLEERLDHNGLLFIKAQASDGGYQIVFGATDEKYTFKISDEVSYTSGKIIEGDFYQMENDIHFDTCLIRNGVNTINSFRTHSYSPSYKVTSNKAVEMGDEYSDNLCSTLEQDWNVGLDVTPLRDILLHANTHDVSYNYLFYVLYKKLKGLLKNEDMVLELLAVEDTHFELLKADLDGIQTHTHFLDVSKKLLTTGCEKMNVLLLYNNISFFAHEYEITEWRDYNDICTEMIFNSYKCSPITPKRAAEGIILT